MLGERLPVAGSEYACAASGNPSNYGLNLPHAFSVLVGNDIIGTKRVPISKSRVRYREQDKKRSINRFLLTYSFNMSDKFIHGYRLALAAMQMMMNRRG